MREPFPNTATPSLKGPLPGPLLPGTKVMWMVLGKWRPSAFSLLTASRYLKGNERV